MGVYGIYVQRETWVHIHCSRRTHQEDRPPIWRRVIIAILLEEVIEEVEVANWEETGVPGGPMENKSCEYVTHNFS